jgi:hypothetical protein
VEFTWTGGAACPGVKGLEVKLTTNLYLLHRLRISAAVTQLTHTPWKSRWIVLYMLQTEQCHVIARVLWYKGTRKVKMSQCTTWRHKWKWRYSSTHSLPRSRFTRGTRSRYPLSRRFGGHHNCSGRYGGEINLLTPPKNRTAMFQTWSPQSRHYTDWAIPASCTVIVQNIPGLERCLCVSQTQICCCVLSIDVKTEGELTPETSCILNVLHNVDDTPVHVYKLFYSYTYIHTT